MSECLVCGRKKDTGAQATQANLCDAGTPWESVRGECAQLGYARLESELREAREALEPYKDDAGAYQYIMDALIAERQKREEAERELGGAREAVKRHAIAARDAGAAGQRMREALERMMEMVGHMLTEGTYFPEHGLRAWADTTGRLLAALGAEPGNAPEGWAEKLAGEMVPSATAYDKTTSAAAQGAASPEGEGK